MNFTLIIEQILFFFFIIPEIYFDENDLYYL